MESDNRDLILSVVIQALEDLKMKGPKCYYDDILTDDDNRYYYGRRETMKWLNVSGRYYLKKLGLSTDMVNRSLKDPEDLLMKLMTYREGT